MVISGRGMHQYPALIEHACARLVVESVAANDRQDYDAFFAEAGGTGLDPQLLRRYYEGMKGMMEQLEQRIQPRVDRGAALDHRGPLLGQSA